MKTNIGEIQKYLKDVGLDGWLMADFHGRNEIAMETLGLTAHLTRRMFYYIPASGEPTGLVHKVERDKFDNLPGKITAYSSYRVLETELASMIGGSKKIAMEYSQQGRLPYIGLVDAGTIELIRALGVEIVSSADIVAHFQARLTDDQIALHRRAAKHMLDIKTAAFDQIAAAVGNGRSINEFDVVSFILDQFDKQNMETDFSPICAVDANAGNPHYEPTAEKSATITKGQLVLIDLWAKLKEPAGTFADISWMAFTGTRDEIPERSVELFDVIARARDGAVKFINENIGSRPVYGSEVDDACRNVIAEAGYGENFVHRTGHSITTSVHGTGPNIDNLETEDRRELKPGHLFSIEPGIYFPDCGLRTEIDVLIVEGGCEVTTLPLQKEIASLL